jgi:thymidylate kinase
MIDVKQLQTSPKINRVICIIGMDGCGKTTHSHLLVSNLEDSGRKCRYIWLGNAYFFSYPFMIVCRALGFTKTHHLAKGLDISEHQYYKNKLISLIWPWVQFLDAIMIVNLRTKLLLWRGFTVVCDRFIPDILVELMMDVNDDRLHKKLVGRLMLRIVPKSAIAILLQVDEKTAWRRKIDVPEMEYLRRRRIGYQLISHSLRIPIVNAEGPIPSVQRQVISIVDELERELSPSNDRISTVRGTHSKAILRP